MPKNKTSPHHHPPLFPPHLAAETALIFIGLMYGLISLFGFLAFFANEDSPLSTLPALIFFGLMVLWCGFSWYWLDRVNASAWRTILGWTIVPTPFLPVVAFFTLSGTEWPSGGERYADLGWILLVLIPSILAALVTIPLCLWLLFIKRSK